MKILLPIDGSKQSEVAVDEIAHRIFSADSEVRVLSVIEALPYFPETFSGEGGNIALYVEAEKSARDQARAVVDNATAKLRVAKERDQLTVTTKVVSGSPKQMILEEADAFDADLIVVGSHGQGMVERFLLGSVSQAVALHAKCSVQIVRTRIHA